MYTTLMPDSPHGLGSRLATSQRAVPVQIRVLRGQFRRNVAATPVRSVVPVVRPLWSTGNRISQGILLGFVIRLAGIKEEIQLLQFKVGGPQRVSLGRLVFGRIKGSPQSASKLVQSA